MKIALFPGSYDPITLGHVEIVHRALKLFDKIIIGIGVNPAKRYMFSLEQRKRWIERCFAHEPRVEVRAYQVLTVEFARSCGAQFLLRGLRSAKDLEYESYLEFINRTLNSELETIYLIASPQTAHISSTLVRELITYRGKLKGLVPDAIIDEIYQGFT